MYKVVKIDGKIREAIDIKGKANKYGIVKEFTYEEAQNFISKHTYIGMSHKYEIIEIVK